MSSDFTVRPCRSFYDGPHYPKGRKLNAGHAAVGGGDTRTALRTRAEAAEAEAERLRASYVPQDVAVECHARLQHAGFDVPGKPNTLWAMVHAACDEVERLRKQLAEVELKLNKAMLFPSGDPNDD